MVVKTSLQLVNERLQERLATGQFNHWALIVNDLGKDLIDGSSASFSEGVFRVAVGASEMAASKAHKYTGFPGSGGLSLN